MRKTLAIAGLLLIACGGGDGASSLAPRTTTNSPQTTTAAAETTAAPAPTPTEETEVVNQVDLPDLGPAEPLREIDGWLQTDIASLEDLRGKVVVVQFWTFGCYNCKNTIFNLQALYSQHQGEEFEIVGIHSPEFAFEEDPDAIAAAAVELGVTWPIALDTRKKTFFGWQGSPAYWPRTYVLDREGKVRFDHIGEGKYEDLNQAVADLLG